MRTYISFRYPAQFVAFSEEDSILSVNGAVWFVELLRRVSDLHVDGELCQEDWGVVIFVRRGQMKFRIGLSILSDGGPSWLAHFHYRSLALLQRSNVLQNLACDFHGMLTQVTPLN